MTAEQQLGPMLIAARWLMLLYVAALPLVRPLDTRILGIHVYATDLIFAAAFFFWIVSIRNRRPRVDLRYLIFIGAYFIAFIISAALSIDPQKSFLKLSGVFYLIAVSIVIADLVQDDDFLKNVTYAWIIGALITTIGSLIGLLGFVLGYDSIATNFFLFHSGSLPAGNYPRVKAFFENPNMTANYINVAAMVVVAAGRIGWFSRKVSIGLCVLLVGAAILTISAGIGGIILSLGLWVSFVAFHDGDKRRRLIIGACAALAFFAYLSTAVSPITRDNEYAVTIPVIEKRIEPSVRFLLWKDSIERGMDYPIFGRGAGMDAAYLEYEVVSGQTQVLRDAHQAWLNVFAQAGLIGLGAFIALCGYLVSISKFRLQETSATGTMLAACSCAFVGAFLFQNLFGSYEDARQLWVLVGMLVGLSASYGRSQNSDAARKRASRISPAVRHRSSTCFARAVSITADTFNGTSGIRLEIGMIGFSKIAFTVSDIPAFGEISKA